MDSAPATGPIGAAPPPPGETPNFAHPRDVVHTAHIAFMVVVQVVVVVFFFIRVCVKLSAAGRFRLEDWSCFAGWLFTVLLNSTVFFKLYHGAGYHIWETTAENNFQLQKWIYVGTLFYTPAAFFTKVAILLLVVRVFAVDRLVARIAKGLVCLPVEAFWDRSIRDFKCIDQTKLFIYDTALGIVSDLVILLVPVILTWTLNVPVIKKVKIVGLLGAGGVAVGVTAYRMYLVVKFENTTDPTVDFVWLDWTVTGELAIGLVCACLPSINYLVERRDNRRSSPNVPRTSSSWWSRRSRKYYDVLSSWGMSCRSKFGGRTRAVTLLQNTNTNTNAATTITGTTPEFSAIELAGTPGSAWGEPRQEDYDVELAKGIGLFDAAPAYQPLAGFNKPEGNLRCCAYSPCGRYFAWASPEVVTVVDASTGSEVLALPILNVYELGFSPLGNFIVTWERPAKDENGDATKNLKVWRTVEDGVAAADKLPVGKFVQKNQRDWNLQYTDDEKFCARQVTNEIQFYESHDLGTVWNKLRVEGVADFALAPGKSHSVAVFVPERKGQPAAVKVFNVPQFTSPISQKTFFKGDKVQLKWNKLGTSILVLAQTEVDKSNKSYYGETTLYLLSVNGAFDARITLDKEGPIHDVSWSPNSKEFGVVYGYMPAKATIFNHRAVATHSFPLGPRNTIIFSPTGRFALVAGFGNLAGQIDVYDLEKDFRKLHTIESGNPSVCTWSPDSRYIMTATTSPRLRVDNGVKLWHVTGPLMYSEDMVELYTVLVRPQAAEKVAGGDPLNPVPTPHASATTYLGSVKTPSKPAGAYRPPGARGNATPLHFKREDEGGAAHVSMPNGTAPIGPNGFGRPRRAVPGAEPVPGANPRVPGADTADVDENLSKAALKNKKKRNNKKKEGDANPEGQNGGGASLAPPPRDFGSGSGHEGRSPERRGGAGANNRHRSHSRNPGAPRNRSNTHRQNGAPQLPNAHGQAAAVNNAAADNSQNPNAKKVRSLQKKVRAIEDLEMRLAGGEKLEETQMKKINTKSSVLKELEVLEKEGH
ncbi:Eukaryotic translation initiation factor 2A [Colletotrichum sidae]|uniref:Eukaryotic translation initiation factor 2A n=1 Tax=Colletotrichum sidae TaxID=1347389 RepID=A0A4R8TBG4_9PEZI|nr:Eukaryotic translation initiation factor 2A [Colletotrichum sidae]